MDMVSIKKFLRPGKPKPEDYIRLLQLALKGISLHTVEANESDLTKFRQEVSTISGKLGERSSAEDIETAVGFVTRAAAGYNRIAARITQAHVQELQAMLAMMTQTITFLSDSSKTGIEQLHVVERSLRKASSIGDVRMLRAKLDDCLTLVRSESNRLRAESQARIAALQEGVERTANHMRSAGLASPEEPAPRPRERVAHLDDPLTGFEGRGAAEELIAANLTQNRDFVVALFLVDTFGRVSGRFGSETGDEVLLLVAQHVEEQLATRSLFRWSGPAVVAILETEPSFDAVEQQMKQIASKRFEKTIDNDGRLVLLPITCSVMVEKVSAGDSPDDVTRNLDRFVSTHAGEET
jgi:GGDEF domain-containing protein